MSFEKECYDYFLTLGISDLRSYGREIGVSRPTTKKKEELIEAIIDIFTGKVSPIKVSNQGAPVKNARVDERIPAMIQSLCEKYDYTDGIFRDFAFVYRQRQQAMRANPSRLVLHDGLDNGNKLPSMEGQVYRANNRLYIFPLDGVTPQEKLLVSSDIYSRYDLREGDRITFDFVVNIRGEIVIKTLSTVNGVKAIGVTRPNFDECPSLVSDDRICVYGEQEGCNTPALKFIEWLAPIAKGQRACVISAPKAGKTRLLLQVAQAAQKLNRSLQVFGLLIDQSMDTIGEYSRVLEESKLLSTTCADTPERQSFVCEYLMNRLKRLAETGEDVLLIIDSFNTLARAYNDTEESSGGKTLSCGLELKTIRYIRKYFNAARALEGFGSLTILGAVSAETGVPMDEVIASEISLQANYELRLDDDLAIRRVYPALDLTKAKSSQGEFFRAETEEDLDFYLRNEALPKLGAEGLLRVLSESNSYAEFVKKIEKL